MQRHKRLVRDWVDVYIGLPISVWPSHSPAPLNTRWSGMVDARMPGFTSLRRWGEAARKAARMGRYRMYGRG